MDFEKLFRIPMLGLKINRTHPGLKKTKAWFVQASFVVGLSSATFIVSIYNIVYHDYRNGDFGLMCKNGTLVLVFIMATVQYSVLIIQGKSLLKLINHVKRDYELMQYLSEEEQMIVKKYSSDAVFICKYWFYMALIGAHLFMFKSFIMMIYYYFIGDFQLVPYYEFTYPRIIEENKTNLFVFVIIYIYTSYYGYYSGVMYASYVPLGPMMMLHASGQLEIVKIRIQNLFVVIDDDIIMEKIKCITKQLQYIYSFVDLIQDVFRIAYEVTLKATTIVLPVTCYEVLEALDRGELSIEFLTFIIGGVLISSSPCYYSDLLMDKVACQIINKDYKAIHTLTRITQRSAGMRVLALFGELVRLALYQCGWEQHYNRRTRSCIQALLIFALRPIAIQTLFKTLCLETLSDLFQQAYTIFNLMNAMLEK